MGRLAIFILLAMICLLAKLIAVESCCHLLRHGTIHFHYPELPEAKANYWLVIEDRKVDLCSFDPGYDIDLEIRTSLRTMSAIWIGLSSVRKELATGALQLEGDRQLARSMEKWLGFSAFAGEKKRAAAQSRQTTAMRIWPFLLAAGGLLTDQAIGAD